MNLNTATLYWDRVTWRQTLHTERQMSLRLQATVQESGRDLIIEKAGRMEGMRTELAIVRGHHDWKVPEIPREARGYFSYFGESAEDDFGQFLSGGVAIPEALFDDIWQRLKLGGHSSATVGLELGPFDFDGFEEWTWKRSTNPFLIIHQAEFNFVREEKLTQNLGN
ncbi:hypothetical protein [Bradyrhizobium algeriense]|uniref:hypothetical protein n=1 Tax=Bradyrhizobium algeriense TaxID=634784 RepID=UPI000D353BDA|nr:hypothetical protein [Bradyrhizobium algeriense]